MSKVDWSKAPAGAEWWAYGTWWKAGEGKKEFSYHVEYGWCLSSSQFSSKLANNYEPRPTEWPETDERIDRIGRDRTEDDMGHYNELREAQSAQKAKSATGPAFEHKNEPSPIQNVYERVIVSKRGTGKCVVDVYRVLDAFKTDSAAIDHAIKKLLCAGLRGNKNRLQDYKEAIRSIDEAVALFIDKGEEL
jgi:hypothetical protein